MEVGADVLNRRIGTTREPFATSLPLGLPIHRHTCSDPVVTRVLAPPTGPHPTTLEVYESSQPRDTKRPTTAPADRHFGQFFILVTTVYRQMLPGHNILGPNSPLTKCPPPSNGMPPTKGKVHAPRIDS